MAPNCAACGCIIPPLKLQTVLAPTLRSSSYSFLETKSFPVLEIFAHSWRPRKMQLGKLLWEEKTKNSALPRQTAFPFVGTNMLMVILLIICILAILGGMRSCTSPARNKISKPLFITNYTAKPGKNHLWNAFQLPKKYFGYPYKGFS